MASGVIALSEQMVADDYTPFCFQWEAGFASGFVGSDFLEAVLLRNAGVQVYDGLVSGGTSFASAEVLAAGQLANDLLFAPGFVRGGTESISGTNFFDAPTHLLDVNPITNELGPQCLMFVGQADYVQQMGPEVGVGIGAFPLPPMEPDDPAFVNGVGTLAYSFSDRPEVRALVQYLASPEWGQVWAVEPGAVDVFFAANKRFDTTFYQGDRLAPDYEVRLRLHEMSHAALETETWRWDLSDLLPPEFGTWTPEFEPGPLWQGMLDWADGAKPIEEILVDLEQTRRDLEAAGGGMESG